ncbi:hypothetical protein EMIHUDRAFT_438535 [Emiliania huxleyi CCMP1516]|uniref:protein-serine/threonine phosphatase n=2 Tax=Emiliania huxleyi TaxID=2903 RepID=A0A0D3I873_EMIH1|nr:hypothetical protein EMIHUDRAFT_438535 [Emiliania huxleyi CCMP1516]EOD07458.1 hypothetical protein EMIHUDRAFT_438535 [Emiliania huxleyi CCMP1516]|eukprot:XP_005759887.1 hypothetical protein EMIHUDRAFT_438535 [Emiliania huxleyi CCMP1516]
MSHASLAEEDWLARSPRRNLRQLLTRALGDDGAQCSEEEMQQHVALLQRADAENKLGRRKLYLLLDLDETLVFAQRLRAGASPAGHLIHVRGEAFDLQLRPGLSHFLSTTGESFIMYLYTMGDEEYVKAVLAVIDPKRTHFTGGVCCWRADQSRTLKTLERAVVEKQMALIVDDTPDVWQADLSNLLLVRRFQGHAGDNGLMQLSSQLSSLHKRFYPPAERAPWSLDGPLRQPPDARQLLAEARGTALRRCLVAFTGVLPDTKDFGEIALCALVRQFGGEVTSSVEEATHLVARQTEGWKQAAKIRQAAQRQGQVSVVWDHWLLDTLCSWQRQPEERYRVPLEEMDGAEAGGAAEAAGPEAAEAAGGAPQAQSGQKRDREGASENNIARMTVAAYLREVKAKSSAAGVGGGAVAQGAPAAAADMGT